MSLSAVEARRQRQLNNSTRDDRDDVDPVPVKRRKLKASEPLPSPPSDPKTSSSRPSSEEPSRGFSPSLPVDFAPEALMSSHDNLAPNVYVFYHSILWPEWLSYILVPSHQFTPQSNVNVFALELQETCDVLGDQTLKTQGVLLVLSEGESLPFYGSFGFTVVSGAARLLGNELGASKNLHSVFAPTSLPPLVISAVDAGEPSLPSLLPERVRSKTPPRASILLLIPDSSNISSLERISPLFRGLFGSRFTQELPNIGIEVCH